MKLGRLALARGTLDRAVHRRQDAQWLAEAWADARTRVLVIDDGQALVRFLAGAGGAADGAAGGGADGVAGGRAGDAARGAAYGSVPGGAELVLVTPAESPDGPRLLLGVDADDVAYFAVIGPLPDGGQRPAAGGPGASASDQLTGSGPAADRRRGAAGVMRAGLRQAGALLGDRDAGLFTHAVALANWHGTHGHCPRCGAPTRLAAAGHLRVCPRDGSEHFPRVDPAVIMLVLDPAGRCLLARNESWPRKRVSILAGFVEPGESVEQAVVREVREEVGIAVAKLRYLGSQPWPMPQSLMLGFCARAAADERDRQIRVDADEIAEARWYSRDELSAALAAGEILLPAPVSIAHQIIEAWYGSALPNVW